MDIFRTVVKISVLVFSTISMIMYAWEAYKAGKVADELSESLDEAEYATPIFRSRALEILYSTASGLNFIIAYMVSQ